MRRRRFIKNLGNKNKSLKGVASMDQTQKRDLHLIVPTLLVVAASFLAYSWASVDISSPSTAYVVHDSFFEDQPRVLQQKPVEKPKSSSSLLTGLAIVEPANCTGSVLFRVTADNQAHACHPDASSTACPLVACNDLGLPASPSYVCDPSCASSPFNQSCNKVIGIGVNISQQFSASGHAETKNFSNYEVNVCVEGVYCDYYNILDMPNASCNSIVNGSQCVASLSSYTNAHVGSCGQYPINICCRGAPGFFGPLDSDGDGIPDDGDTSGIAGDHSCLSGQLTNCDDNCINIPNGPVLGACLNNTAMNCTSSAQCATGICEQAQLDTDGDTAGDVCDLDPFSSCTINAPASNCPGLISCSLTGAAWASTTKNEGSNVNLAVYGNSNCNGLNFQFVVTDTGDPTVPTVSPQPATFSAGSASSSWVAEFSNDPQANNQFVFQASTVVNGSSVTIASSNALTVTSNGANATCGNGIREGSNNEECDDGNSGNNDGCSGNCTLEGILGSQCSNECAFKSLGTCPTEGGPSIKFCGNYDPDPCLEGSTPLNCASGTKCTSSNGDAACTPPICQDAFECTLGACVNGIQQRTCTNTGQHVCNYYFPQTQIQCVNAEQPTQIPGFTMVSLMTSILLLIGWYGIVLRRKDEEKR